MNIEFRTQKKGRNALRSALCFFREQISDYWLQLPLTLWTSVTVKWPCSAWALVAPVS